MNAIINPENGLIIYCLDCSVTGALAIFSSGAWFLVAPNCVLPLSPSAGTHVPWATQIIWNWNTVSGVASYKWSATNNYATATDMGTATTITETGLTCNTGYLRYIWAYNTCGYSLVTSLNQSTGTCFTIGQTYGGGVIFYIDGTGIHGLIAAPGMTNQHGWGCDGFFLGGTSSAIGTGQANTTRIVNQCPEAGIPARICNDLVVNGYDDWFLPSIDELYQMFLQKTAIGGFTNDFYWSSSENDAFFAWYMNFYGSVGIPYCCNYPKSNSFRLRAVRAF